MKMGVAETIKKMMKSKKITQTEVAERIGKTQASVAMYLKNANGLRVDNLMNVADACGFDLALVNRDDPNEVLYFNDSVSKPTVSGKKDKEELYRAFTEWYESVHGDRETLGQDI